MSLETSFSSSETGSLFFGEFLEMVENGLRNHAIVPRDPSPLFKLLTQLPNTGTRLKWNKIPHIGLFPPSGLSRTTTLKEIGYPKQQQEFLESIGNYFRLLDEHGFLFEDRFSDCALELAFKDFLKLVPGFIEMPAHWYFLSVKGTWLVNITFEDHTYFSGQLALIDE